MLGEGILQGLLETARNFFGSYVEKDRLTTVQYPEERFKLPEASRNFPFLLYDGKDPDAGLRCVSCQICEKECPPRCIHIEKSKDKKPDFVGKQQFYPAVFNIDVAVCMSCQICVEVCSGTSTSYPNRTNTIGRSIRWKRRRRMSAALRKWRMQRPKRLQRLQQRRRRRLRPERIRQPMLRRTALRIPTHPSR
jgi:formate hydrogenlyase subunit 6/NADH:ubiquinone oxidoreductase subunit I